MADLQHLNELYGLSEDPWHMRGDWDAERRRDLLLASLNHPRYGSTFVPGCGTGELLPALARRVLLRCAAQGRLGGASRGALCFALVWS